MTRSAAGPLAVVATLVVLWSAPGFASASTIDTLTTLGLLAAAAQAWNVIGGFGGQFSLGHAAFIGTGAYGAALLLIHTGVPLPVAVLGAAVACATVAALVAIPLFRLSGASFSIGSLAVALALASWMTTWQATGASQGLNVPFESIPEPVVQYRWVVGVLVVATLVVWWLGRSAFGLRLMAVRDDEAAAAALGVSGTRVKTGAFVLSAALAGAVGALVAVRQISIEPTAMFGLGWTIDMVVMVVVGGIGTVAGPIVGAVAVYFLIERQLEEFEAISAAITGLLVIVVIRFAPDGLVGAGRTLLRRTIALRRGAGRPTGRVVGTQGAEAP